MRLAVAISPIVKHSGYIAAYSHFQIQLRTKYLDPSRCGFWSPFRRNPAWSIASMVTSSHLFHIQSLSQNKSQVKDYKSTVHVYACILNTRTQMYMCTSTPLPLFVSHIVPSFSVPQSTFVLHFPYSIPPSFLICLILHLFPYLSHITPLPLFVSYYTSFLLSHITPLSFCLILHFFP